MKDDEKTRYKGVYVSTFKKLFGLKWQPVIALHYSLQMNRQSLFNSFGFGSELSED